MIIINTDYKNFDAYLHLLSKPAKKNYSYVKKHNQDIHYEQIPFDKEELEQFMQVWEQQTVFGKSIQWAFPFSHIEMLAKTGKLLCFRAQKAGVTIAVHFIQKRIGFWECHAPLYEKNEENEKRYLAKYMWFSLIHYFIEHQLGCLDMGGGLDTWRETIERRNEFPHLNYKWLYVIEDAKKYPEREVPYKMKQNGAEKKLDYDLKALFHPRHSKLLRAVIRARFKEWRQGNDIDDKHHYLDAYQGETIEWIENKARYTFIAKGIYDDGWTEKKVSITWKNKDLEYINLLVEFPHWSGKKRTSLQGKINGKHFINRLIKAGQTLLSIGPLQKEGFNTMTLVLGKKFNMPSADQRSCYLRIIQFESHPNAHQK